MSKGVVGHKHRVGAVYVSRRGAICAELPAGELAAQALTSLVGALDMPAIRARDGLVEYIRSGDRISDVHATLQGRANELRARVNRRRGLGHGKHVVKAGPTLAQRWTEHKRLVAVREADKAIPRSDVVRFAELGESARCTRTEETDWTKYRDSGSRYGYPEVAITLTVVLAHDWWETVHRRGLDTVRHGGHMWVVLQLLEELPRGGHRAVVARQGRGKSTEREVIEVCVPKVKAPRASRSTKKNVGTAAQAA